MVGSMALGDKPTFDPYSIGDFSLRDVFRSGVRSWKHRRWAFLAFATFACLPSLSAYLMSSPWLNLLFAASGRRHPFGCYFAYRSPNVPGIKRRNQKHLEAAEKSVNQFGWVGPYRQYGHLLYQVFLYCLLA